MTDAEYDSCYAGIAADGKMILWDHFAESIRHEYLSRGLTPPHFDHVAPARARATDAAPADPPSDPERDKLMTEAYRRLRVNHRKAQTIDTADTELRPIPQPNYTAAFRAIRKAMRGN